MKPRKIKNRGRTTRLKNVRLRFATIDLLNLVRAESGWTTDRILRYSLKRIRRMVESGKLPRGFQSLSGLSTPASSKPKRKSPPPKYIPRVD